MITIYGIFKKERCLYVGRTQDPYTREKSHRTRFGKRIEFRILAEASKPTLAGKFEKQFIEQFKSVQEAKFNGCLNPRRTNRTSVTINESVHRRLKILSVKTGRWLEDILDEAAFRYLKAER